MEGINAVAGADAQNTGGVVNAVYPKTLEEARATIDVLMREKGKMQDLLLGSAHKYDKSEAAKLMLENIKLRRALAALEDEKITTIRELEKCTATAERLRDQIKTGGQCGR